MANNKGKRCDNRAPALGVKHAFSYEVNNKSSLNSDYN